MSNATPAVMMRALLPGSDGAQLGSIAVPQPGLGQVLVRVHAAPLNRADLAMRMGAAHGNVGGAGIALGLEWAGEIAAVGEGVRDWQVGMRVMGAGAGAFAEYTLAHAAMLYPVPDTMSLAVAACLPVALQTMHDAIATTGDLSSGETVLIQGASSGVGLMGLQIAKALGAGRVIGTSTSAHKRAQLSGYGADLTFDTNEGDWAGQLLAATDGRGVDLVIDQLAGPLINDTMRVTALGGRIVNIGRMAGESGMFDFDLHSLRRIRYTGSTFRTRPGRAVVEIVRRAREALIPAIAAGAITMPTDSAFALADANAAFAKMTANRHFGKILLTLA